MRETLRRHWPEYLMEAALLGGFLLSACTFATLLQHPGSPVHQALPDPLLRLGLMGTAMGLTLVGLVYSPWGKQSGAHMNPCVTLTFCRLGKVPPQDACWYALAQFGGGILGVCLAVALLMGAVGHPDVNYAVTAPGEAGIAVAFLAEASIAFGMMTLVLHLSNHKSLAPYTGMYAGCLVALYIFVESPISGMSMNPARTVGSAFSARSWTALWIYFTAPPLGMLLASELYVRLKGAGSIRCAKLHHHNDRRCIFCGYPGRK
jgi:aquaporin Z